MAENLEVRPSFERVSGLLAGIPQDTLILLEHKLNGVRRDTRSCKLLQAMILLTLRQEAEARELLDTLRDDVAAAHICRRHWGGTQVSNTHLPKQEAQMAWAVAQVYSLLAEEKLCCPQARDEAYRVAIKAFHSSSEVQSTKLDVLLAEARDKCGLGFVAEVARGEFYTLKSDPEKLPRSAPIPINSSLGTLGQPLRSTGTPGSVVSHFEISQSPTMPYLTRSSHQRCDPKVSKLCESTPSSLEQPGEGRTSLGSLPVCRSGSLAAHDQPQSHSIDDFQGCHLGPSEDASALEESVHSPVQCSEPPNLMPAAVQDRKEGTPPNPRTAHTMQAGPATTGCIQTSLGDSCSPCQNTGPEAASSPADVPPVTLSSSADSPSDENQFFMFVVVHANEDEGIACRVKELLESMGVPHGATFCEDFLVPGHNQLACFQDALDNSAFTLLLLTENFRSRLCIFQTNMALMNSFTHLVKSNSVIPFVPKESPLKKEEMPSMLVGIAALDENSPVFKKNVKKTFTLSEFQRKKFAWSMTQQIQRQEQLHEQQQNYWQMQQRFLALSLRSGYPAQLPFPPTQMSFPGLPHVPPSHVPLPFFPPTFYTPGMSQPPPGLGQASPSQPCPVPLPAPMPRGTQPSLIIQHAQMVQIGDYNTMQVEGTKATLGVTEDDINERQGTEAEGGNRQ